MRGAAPRAMQELGAHKDLATTMRYAHLTPSATRAAIQLLEPASSDGEIQEKEESVAGKS